jgi:hypothetical protein
MEKKAHNGLFAKLRIKRKKRKKLIVIPEEQLWPGPRREGTMLKDLPTRFIRAQVKKLTVEKKLKGFLLDELARRHYE